LPEGTGEQRSGREILCRGDDAGRIQHTHQRLDRTVLLLVAFLIVVYSLTPFEFRTLEMELVDRALEGLRAVLPSHWLDAVRHFGVFLILGLLLGVSAPARFLGNRKGILFSAGVIFCLSIEIGQIFAEGRHARLGDLVANVSGLASGLYWTGGLRSFANFWSKAQNLYLRQERAFHLALLILAVSGWVTLGAVQHRKSLTLDWDPQYYLLLGNEADELRPWFGEIRHLAFYDRALTSDEIRRRARHSLTGQSQEKVPIEGLLTEYDFSGGPQAVITPRGPLGSAEIAVSVPGEVAWDNGRGLVLERPVVLASQGPVTTLVEAIESTGEFTLELLFRPAALDQAGPARIVSVSQTIWLRNVTLGQEGKDLHFRVRNRVNGPNGIDHALIARGTLSGELHHFTAVYSNGVSALFRDGERVGDVFDLRHPSIPLGLGGNSSSRVVALLFLAWGAALPAALLFARSRRPWVGHCLAVLLAFGVAIAPMFLDGLPDLPESGQTAVVLAAAYPVILWFVQR
jgi:VanZ family protein